ncbi:potassium channel subfamily K member 4 isoform X2 [Lucilia cuprina]|uniref:potassium channel subfamily K member 4 isoform X2 n=1 Tax=Lucilia cuprina TaxID=7375 RepID=UPI001F062B0F|nr:potassium channel subfamily K member 4 isoform X2 [Lucilia cuprina]
MSQSTPTPPPSRFNNRPPRIHIKNLYNNNGSAMGSMPPSAQPPITAQTSNTLGPGSVTGQPYWPQYSNPFAAGNFMARGFDGFVDFTKSGMSFGEKFTYGLYNKISKWSKKWFTHFFLLTVVSLYTVGGALVFQAIEGREFKKEQIDIHNSQKAFYSAIRDLANNVELLKLNPGLFDGKLTEALRDHQPAVETLLNNNKTMEEMANEANPWSFWNSMFYCGTIYTTIGYGHITPKTRFGQSLTIAYAIIGIPMFLILLADFGKLFTRAIKFIWGYVRRLYYTGTCRSIRKQQQVRDAMTGFSTVYDMAIRRPSHFFGMGADTDVESQASEAGKSHPETPTSPYPETIVVDDEFNLPISLASILLITYILLGTFVYTLWEDWTYFEAFYFVFISMSTIGFGDLVPNHPIFMMCSIIYLVFGLALTSMFINVVQIKLSDTFKDASAKIGATLGVGASELGDEASQAKTPSELASVHGSRLDKIAEDENEELSSASPPLQSILRPSRPNSPANQEDQSNGEVGPPPLLPRRQMSVEQPPVVEKKKKRRFFK